MEEFGVCAALRFALDANHQTTISAALTALHAFLTFPEEEEWWSQTGDLFRGFERLTEKVTEEKNDTEKDPLTQFQHDSFSALLHSQLLERLKFDSLEIHQKIFNFRSTLDSGSFGSFTSSTMSFAFT